MRRKSFLCRACFTVRRWKSLSQGEAPHADHRLLWRCDRPAVADLQVGCAGTDGAQPAIVRFFWQCSSPWAQPPVHHLAPKDDGYRGIWFTLGQKSRVRRQVFRRPGHLHRQPRAHGHLRQGGEQDVFRLRRRQGGQAAPAGHGLVLRPRARRRAAADHRARQAGRRTIRTTTPACASTPRATLGVRQRPRPKPAGLHLPQHASPTASTQFELDLRAGDHLSAAAVDRRPGLPAPVHQVHQAAASCTGAPARTARHWTPDQKFAGMGGHYQTSHQRGNRVITAFNMHPGGNVDKRTNLYFLQTDDMGRTWRNVAGRAGRRAAGRAAEPGPGARLPGREAAGLHPRPGPRPRRAGR